MCVFEKEAL